MADFGPTKTICAGRMLLDVSQNTKVKLHSSYRSIEIKQAGYVNSFSDIEREYEHRADLLKNQKMDEPVSAYAKKLQREGQLDQNKNRFVGFDVNADSGFFVFGEHKDAASSQIVVALHKRVGGNHYAFTKENLGASKYSYARNILIDAASRFTLLKPNEIPQRPGFCVDGGIFVDQGPPEANETFTLVLEFPQHPDVRFSIESIAIDEPDDEEPLERRADRDLAVMREHVDGVQVLDRGQREAAAQRGYQLAISAPYDIPGTRISKFFWGAQGVPRDVSRPFLEVDMMIEPAGEAPSSFADDEQARVFWEQLLSSLRIRPGAV